ncbi:putative membrane protein [Escherichia coli 96.0107]|nr:hypothetical protein ECH7EC4501_1742 [Escherichia coli O157:H7 str. EC4501]EHV23378.1 putative membrane protein [Escherichia coli DEC4F]EIN26531.1 hypothetical protein ECFDA505_2077 [Escherichia coli FDA505]EIN61854.1 hypothetical protein ECPA5_2039 [Escherichia coli PA5]EKJ17805.1 hypothetical protein ECEC1865_2069 [Escherichia coli EC1865]EKJ63959.1 hypothetical protein EC01304_2197 [Escherichia coli 0.1304]EKK31530.1 putative membrane protein [Escherichia coli 3.4870]EKW66491.1 putativ
MAFTVTDGQPQNGHGLTLSYLIIFLIKIFQVGGALHRQAELFL